ncbi:phospholipase D-like domain-containing protein [Nocardioides insulae]|uniref:phospholipase D-like domain-containing protein n=1 Tax=Nocardioides insulae TaxID=394734 RepID=UPI001FE07D8F|nr:phospholipase D family protein [Nocardioides insulae]
MVGSVNLTRHNATHQWNDLYTVADRRVWRAYNRWFAQLKADIPRADPYVATRAGASRIDFTPIDLRRHPDPVLRAMGRIGCTGGTSVDIAAYAWNGMRGRDIAKRVAGLSRSGCRVRVILGEGTGSAVRSILTNSRVGLKRSRVRGVTTHQKMMVVRGRIDGVPTGRVWTGSHNWSSRSAARDDVFVEIADQGVVTQYQRGFALQWAKG